MTELLLILVFLIVSIGFVFAALFTGWFVRPNVKEADKVATYECGERPFHKGWFNYNPRFYIFALIFIVFDVAVAILMPPLSVFRQTLSEGSSISAWIGIAIFVGLLSVPLFYVWRRGDLEWIKKN